MQRRETTRRRRRTGGKELNRGSYGAVFGHPRLRCQNETDTHYNQNSSSQVSKILFNRNLQCTINGKCSRHDDIIREESLQNIPREIYKIPDIRQYVELPIRKCTWDKRASNGTSNQQIVDDARSYSDKYYPEIIIFNQKEGKGK